MANRDLISNVKTVKQLAGTYSTTQTPSTGVDTRGFDSVLVQCAIGTMTNVGGSPNESWTFALQHSDTSNSDFANVSSDDVILDSGNNAGSISSGVFATIDAASEDDAVYTVGYIGSKRYLRVVATAANTPGATAIAVLYALGNPALAPASDA